MILEDKKAPGDWLRNHLAAGDVALVEAARAARFDEMAAAFA